MTSGIYCIKNSVDGKVYIGKSINIERRIGEHKRSLVKDICGKDINRHLYNAVKKYGIDSFSFDIIDCVSSEEDLTDREMYWMIKCDSTNREFGYNLRLDSSTRCYVHPETIEIQRVRNKGVGNPNYGNKWNGDQKSRMSEIAKYRHSVGFYGESWKNKISEKSSVMWLDGEKKSEMVKKVSETKRLKNCFEQYSRDGVLLKVWDSVFEIIENNPTYKWQNIYSVCNGYKKTYMGYIWKKKTKK